MGGGQCARAGAPPAIRVHRPPPAAADVRPQARAAGQAVQHRRAPVRPLLRKRKAGCAARHHPLRPDLRRPRQLQPARSRARGGRRVRCRRRLQRPAACSAESLRAVVQSRSPCSAAPRGPGVGRSRRNDAPWRHTGFSIHNAVRVRAGDAAGRRRLAQYMLRAPFSLEKMSYDPVSSTVIYRSRMHKTLKRNYQIMPGADWLAQLCAHIPDHFEHLVRYAGWYSNRSRGKRRRAGIEPAEVTLQLADVHESRRVRSTWARMIHRNNPRQF
ncbi:MAG: transposase [Pseudomonadota bacterium]